MNAMKNVDVVATKRMRGGFRSPGGDPFVIGRPGARSKQHLGRGARILVLLVISFPSAVLIPTPERKMRLPMRTQSEKAYRIPSGKCTFGIG